MRPSELKTAMSFCIKNKFPLLVKGSPGIGKSDIVEQATKEAGARLIISHPVVSDPTDYKGLPFAEDGKAHFLPFGELVQLIEAKEPTVYFLDDLGQAPPAVQAAVMQLLLARRINGNVISEHVTFIAATNRKEDKAAVSGILEPVKSRFAAIVELDVNADDWVKWALQNNMPTELIAFIRFKPDLLNDFKPSRDIVNSPSPRTVAYVGKMQNSGIPQGLQFELFKGAVGEGFASEYAAFLRLFKDLPDIAQIFLNPDTIEMPTKPDILYALSGAIAHKITDTTAESGFKFIKRMPPEIGIACVKDLCARNPAMEKTRAFIDFAVNNGNIIM